MGVLLLEEIIFLLCNS